MIKNNYKDKFSPTQWHITRNWTTITLNIYHMDKDKEFYTVNLKMKL